jgi:hypothetical protein
MPSYNLRGGHCSSTATVAAASVALVAAAAKIVAMAAVAAGSDDNGGDRAWGTKRHANHMRNQSKGRMC